MNTALKSTIKENSKTESRDYHEQNNVIKTRLKETLNADININSNKLEKNQNQRNNKKMKGDEGNKSKGINSKNTIKNIPRPHTSLNHQSRLNKVLNQDNFIYQKPSLVDNSNQNCQQFNKPSLKKSRAHKKNSEQDNQKIKPKVIQLIAAYCPRILTQVGLKRDSSMDKFNKTHFKCQVKQNFVEAMVTYFFQWKKKVKIIFQSILKDISGQNDFNLQNKYKQKQDQSKNKQKQDQSKNKQKQDQSKNKQKQDQSKIYLSLKEIELITKQCQENLEIISKQHGQKNHKKKITQNTNMMHQPMAILITQQNQQRNQQKIDIILKDFQLLMQYVALLMKLLKQYENFIIQANECLKNKSKDNTQEYFKQIKLISIKYHKSFNEIIDMCLKSRYHQFLERIQFKIKKLLQKETDKYLKVFQSSQILNQVEKDIQHKFEELNQLIQTFVTNPKSISQKRLQKIDAIFSDIQKLSSKMHIDLVNKQFQKKKKQIIQKTKKFKSQYGVKLILCIQLLFKQYLKKMTGQSILLYLKYEGALYLEIKKSLLLVKKLYQQMKNEQSQAFILKIQTFRMKISQKLVQIMQYEADITILKKDELNKNHKENQLSETLVYLNEVKSLITCYQNTKQQICIQLKKLFSQKKNQEEATFILSEQKTQKKDDLNQIFAQGRQDIKNLENFTQLLKWTRQVAPFLDIFQLKFWSQNDILSDNSKIWQNKLSKLIEQQYSFEKLAQSQLIQFLTPIVQQKNMNTTSKKQQKSNSNVNALFSSFLNMHSDSLPSLKNRYQYQFAHCFQQIEDVRRMALKIHEKKDKISGVAVQQFRQFVQQKKSFLKNLKNGQNAVDLVDRIYSSMSNLNYQSQEGDKQGFIQQVDLSILALIFEQSNQDENNIKINNKLLEHVGILLNLAKNLNKKYLAQQFSNLEIILSKISNLIISLQTKQQISKSPLKAKKRTKSTNCKQILNSFSQFFKMTDITCKTIYQKNDSKMYLLNKNNEKLSYCKIVFKNFNITDQMPKLKIDQVLQISQLTNAIWKLIQGNLAKNNEITTKQTFNQIQKEVNNLIEFTNLRLNVYYQQILKSLYAFKSYPLSNQQEVQTILSKQIQKFKFSQNSISKFKVLKGKHYPINWQLFSLLNTIITNLFQTSIFQQFYKVILDDQLIVFCASTKEDALNFCFTKFFDNRLQQKQKLPQKQIFIIDQKNRSISILEDKIVNKCQQFLKNQYVPLNQKEIIVFLFLIKKASSKNAKLQQIVTNFKIISKSKSKLLKILQQYKKCLDLLNQNVSINQKIEEIQNEIQLIQCLLQNFSNFTKFDNPAKRKSDTLKPKLYPVQEGLIMLQNNFLNYNKIEEMLNKCKISYFKIIFGDQLNQDKSSLQNLNGKQNQYVIGFIQSNSIQSICNFLSIDLQKNKKSKILQQVKQSLMFSQNNIILTKNIIGMQFFNEKKQQQIANNLKAEHQINYFMKELDKFLINITINEKSTSKTNDKSTSKTNDKSTSKTNDQKNQKDQILNKQKKQRKFSSTLKGLFDKKQYFKIIQTFDPIAQIKIQFTVSGIIDLTCDEQLNSGLFVTYRSQFLQEYLCKKIEQAKNIPVNQISDNDSNNDNANEKQQNNLGIFLKQMMIVSKQNQKQKQQQKEKEKQQKQRQNLQQKQSLNLNLKQKNKQEQNTALDDIKNIKQKQNKIIKRKNSHSNQNIDDQQKLMIQIDLSQGWNVQQVDFIELLEPNQKSKFREKQTMSKLKTTQNYNKTAASNFNSQQNQQLHNMQVDELSIVFSEMNIEDRNTIVQFNLNEGHLKNFVDVKQLINQKLQEKKQKLTKQKNKIEKK